MTGPPVTEVTLRALEGTPLADPRVRDMVESTACAIAERQGVKVVQVRTRADRIVVRLETGRVEAIGFAAELRRLTTRWYEGKYGKPNLWGEPREEDDADWWKQS